MTTVFVTVAALLCSVPLWLVGVIFIVSCVAENYDIY